MYYVSGSDMRRDILVPKMNQTEKYSKLQSCTKDNIWTYYLDMRTRKRNKREQDWKKTPFKAEKRLFNWQWSTTLRGKPSFRAALVKLFR